MVTLNDVGSHNGERCIKICDGLDKNHVIKLTKDLRIWYINIIKRVGKSSSYYVFKIKTNDKFKPEISCLYDLDKDGLDLANEDLKEFIKLLPEENYDVEETDDKFIIL